MSVELTTNPKPLGLRAIKRDLLHIVARNPETPAADLHRMLEDVRRETINQQTVYRALWELDDAGLVEKTAIDGRAKAHELTAAGRLRLEEHRQWTTNCLQETNS